MKQRSIRKKSALSFDEDEGEQDGGSLGMPPASVKAVQAQKDKERKAKEKKSLLSFEEEAGGEEAGSGAAAKKAPGGATAGGGAGRARASLRAPGLPSIAAERTAVYTQQSAAGARAPSSSCWVCVVGGWPAAGGGELSPPHLASARPQASTAQSGCRSWHGTPRACQPQSPWQRQGRAASAWPAASSPPVRAAALNAPALAQLGSARCCPAT